MATTFDCAQAVLDAVPLVMRSIRMQLRSHRHQDISVPQFRILIFINKHTDASLSEVADHIGLTLPTLSKMVDLLVTRGWVMRSPCPEDRRRLQLGLTARGKVMLDQALESTRASLARSFEGFSPDDLDRIVNSMDQLQSVFSRRETV